MAVLKLPGSEETDMATGWSRARMWSLVDDHDVEQDQARGACASHTMDAYVFFVQFVVCLFASFFFHTLAWTHQTSIEVTSDLVCCKLSVNLVPSLQTNLVHPQPFFFFLVGSICRRSLPEDGVLTYL